MNGGRKSVSLLAICATAGIFAGASSALAADLGGDCCADLEERVAELEATTARKGNRKVSLTVYGSVNRIITYLNDGQIKKTYFGLDSTNASSRFGFMGEAKITPSWKAGFEILIEIEAGGTSSKTSQLDEDGKLGNQFGGNTSGSFNQINVDAYFGDARRVAFWVENKDIGRFTLGRWEGAGVQAAPDLAGIQTVASASFILINGATFFRSKQTGNLTGLNIQSIGDPAAFSSQRTELLRWDSPTLAGFIASASIGEAGDYWGAMLRYANEFQGFRVAGALGYEQSRDRATTACNAGTGSLPVTALGVACGTAAAGAIAIGNLGFNGFDGDIKGRPNVTAYGIGLSALHVPTGLFAQGHWNRATFGGDPNGYWGYAILQDINDKKSDLTHWLIQAGLSKNYFGPGVTAFFGEYGKVTGAGAESGTGRRFAAPALSVAGSFDTVAGVNSSTLTIWGLGVTQNIDAASMQLYLGYRNYGGSVTQNAAGIAGSTNATSNTTLRDINMITAGGRISF